MYFPLSQRSRRIARRAGVVCLQPRFSAPRNPALRRAGPQFTQNNVAIHICFISWGKQLNEYHEVRGSLTVSDQESESKPLRL